MRLRLGRNVFGVAAMAFGVITLNWHQVDQLANLSQSGILIYFFAVAELVGGIAMQWQKTARPGAIIIGAVSSVFSLYWIPQMFKTPLLFDPYGIFGEQFSIFIGAAMVFASTMLDQQEKAAKIEKAAYISYGICVITYSLYQLFYLDYTASLVPKWIPPGQMFWTIVTTIAFALAAVALLSGKSALLASRLLTIMLILFGLLIWVPACVIHPEKISNWVENSSNLAMVGTAWIVVEYLSKRFSTKTSA